jgi:tetratricopeptide (TPR) repeat protein
LTILGEVALNIDVTQAPSHFQAAIKISRDIKMENELALAHSGMGRYHKLRGEHAEARRYLTQALEIFVRLGTLLEPDKVRKELADLPQHPLPDARD